MTTFSRIFLGWCLSLVETSTYRIGSNLDVFFFLKKRLLRCCLRWEKRNQTCPSHPSSALIHITGLGKRPQVWAWDFQICTWAGPIHSPMSQNPHHQHSHLGFPKPRYHIFENGLTKEEKKNPCTQPMGIMVCDQVVIRLSRHIASLCGLTRHFGWCDLCNGVLRGLC